MAFSASGILIVRPSGSDTNGGGFNPGNANFPTDGAVSAANTSSPVVSSASYTFVAGDVGARWFGKAGTSLIPGWYTIVSVSAGAATLSAPIGSATLFNATAKVATGLNTVVGCGTASSLSGVTWGIDYSNQDAAQISFTDLVVGATTTQFTSAAHPVGKNFVGNYMWLASGTGFNSSAGFEIVSTSGTTATCDKSLGTAASSGGVAALGGAMQTASQAGLAIAGSIGGCSKFFKTGTYTTTGFAMSVNGTMASPSRVEGFATIPKDRGSPPTIKSTGGVTTLNVTGNNCVAANLIVDGNATAATGIKISGGTVGGVTIDSVTVKGCNTAGIDGTSVLQSPGNSILKCSVTTCPIGIKATLFDIVGTEVFSCTGNGYFCCSCTITDCIASLNGGVGFISDDNDTYGNNVGVGWLPSHGNTYKNSTAYGNTSDGFTLTTGSVVVGCLSEGNGGYGFNSDGTDGGTQLMYCGTYNNTLGALGPNLALAPLAHVFNVTGSFFVSASTGNFALNNTANQGAAARATGYPGTLPRGLSVGFLDMGAVQHQDPASGGVNGSRQFVGM